MRRQVEPDGGMVFLQRRVDVAPDPAVVERAVNQQHGVADAARQLSRTIEMDVTPVDVDKWHVALLRAFLAAGIDSVMRRRCFPVVPSLIVLLDMRL